MDWTFRIITQSPLFMVLMDGCVCEHFGACSFQAIKKGCQYVQEMSSSGSDSWRLHMKQKRQDQKHTPDRLVSTSHTKYACMVVHINPENVWQLWWFCHECYIYILLTGLCSLEDVLHEADQLSKWINKRVWDSITVLFAYLVWWVIWLVFDWVQETQYLQ